MRRPGRGRVLRVTVLLIGALTACQVPPKQAAQDFVAATNALAQAESDYFDQIQAASDASLQLSNGFAYVDHHMRWKDLAPRLTRRNDFSKAKALRLTALSQLRNYAQQIEAISASSGDTSAADAAKSAISDIARLGSDQGVLKISSSQLTLVQTAVDDLARAIAAHQTAREIQSLARQASGPISDIETMLDSDKSIIENTSYASELGTDQTIAVTAILSAVYADSRVNSAERLSVYSRFIANWKPAIVTKGQDIADAMKKLQSANDAMKMNQQIAASSLAQDAYQLATQALATQAVKK